MLDLCARTCCFTVRSEFWEELETLARAKSAGQMSNAPMDPPVFHCKSHHCGTLVARPVTKRHGVRKRRNNHSRSSSITERVRTKVGVQAKEKPKGKHKGKSDSEKCYKIIHSLPVPDASLAVSCAISVTCHLSLSSLSTPARSDLLGRRSSTIFRFPSDCSVLALVCVIFFFLDLISWAHCPI